MQINFRLKNAAFDCESNPGVVVKIAFIEQTIKFTGLLKHLK